MGKGQAVFAVLNHCRPLYSAFTHRIVLSIPLPSPKNSTSSISLTAQPLFLTKKEAFWGGAWSREKKAVEVTAPECL